MKSQRNRNETYSKNGLITVHEEKANLVMRVSMLYRQPRRDTVENNNLSIRNEINIPSICKEQMHVRAFVRK